MTDRPLYEQTPAIRATRATWAKFFKTLNLPEPYRLSGPFTPDRATYYLALAKMPPRQRYLELSAAHEQALVEDNWRIAGDLEISLDALDQILAGMTQEEIDAQPFLHPGGGA